MMQKVSHAFDLVPVSYNLPILRCFVIFSGEDDLGSGSEHDIGEDTASTVIRKWC